MTAAGSDEQCMEHAWLLPHLYQVLLDIFSQPDCIHVLLDGGSCPVDCACTVSPSSLLA